MPQLMWKLLGASTKTTFSVSWLNLRVEKGWKTSLSFSPILVFTKVLKIDWYKYIIWVFYLIRHRPNNIGTNTANIGDTFPIFDITNTKSPIMSISNTINHYQLQNLKIWYLPPMTLYNFQRTHRRKKTQLLILFNNLFSFFLIMQYAYVPL